MLAAIIMVIVLVRQKHKRKARDYNDQEKGGQIFEPRDITPPPATYRGFNSRSDLTLYLDDSAFGKGDVSKSSPPYISISPPSSEDSPPVAKKWKHKRVPVPRLSRLPPSPISRTRSWLSSPRFSRRSSRSSRKSGQSLPPPSPGSPIPPVPTISIPRVPSATVSMTSSRRQESPTQDFVLGTVGRPTLKLSIP